MPTQIHTQSPEALAFDKARQEMLHYFAALCARPTVAREEIEATKAAMKSLLSIQNMDGQA